MNRRHAIISILLLIIAVLFAKWRKWSKPVNLAVLKSKEPLITEIAETIIPRTATPGAKDAHVAAFVVAMVTEGLSGKEQRTFVNGLIEVDTYCLNEFRLEFVSCAQHEREQCLTYFANNGWWMSNTFASKVQNKLFGRPFFPLMRDLTVIGYCTSEVGATKGLAYDYIPAEYNPCMLMQNDQRSWATT